MTASVFYDTDVYDSDDDCYGYGNGYYVELYDDGQVIDIAGPFDDIQDAELAGVRACKIAE